MTVVKGDGVPQMLASSSYWIVLQHSFEDHVPFLGRIERDGFRYYENGNRQSLNVDGDSWTTTCFDEPLVVHRQDAHTVRGFTLDNERVVDVTFGDDDFIERLDFVTHARRVSMQRLSTTPSTSAHGFWFARSTAVASGSCGTFPIPERARDRTLVVIRIHMGEEESGAVLHHGSRNLTVQTAGIQWFPMQQGVTTMRACDCVGDVHFEIVAIDMYHWSHALADARLVTEIA